MATKIKLDTGPHKLSSIDVYAPNDEDAGYTLPFKVAHNYDGTILRIDDALGEKAADAYFNGDEDANEEREQAKQWLLDFTCISAGGR